MSNVEKVQSTETVIVYTYRYIWKTKDGRLCVKFLTDVQEAHKTFQTNILKDDNIVSCAREYMHEINFNYIGFTESVKVEEKKSE